MILSRGPLCPINVGDRQVRPSEVPSGFHIWPMSVRYDNPIQRVGTCKMMGPIFLHPYTFLTVFIQENFHLTNYFHLKKLLIFFIQMTTIIQSLVFIQLYIFFIHIQFSSTPKFLSITYDVAKGTSTWPPFTKIALSKRNEIYNYTSKNSRNLRSTPIALKLFLVLFFFDFNISTVQIFNWTFLDHPLSSFNFEECNLVRQFQHTPFHKIKDVFAFPRSYEAQTLCAYT